MAEQKAKKRRQKLRKNQIDLDEYLCSLTPFS
jgi:hypothetical protein